MDRNPQKDCLIGWFEFEIEFIFTNKEDDLEKGIYRIKLTCSLQGILKEKIDDNVTESLIKGWIN